MKKLISITCFVLAVLISGCQEHASSGSAVKIEHSPIKAAQVNEKKDVVDTVKAQEKNNPIVTAYYFHRTMRCPTCLAIEANVARVIEDNFSQQVADGSLIWIPFNLDDPGGEELEKEFDVSVSTLVLSKQGNKNHTGYKKLGKVWDFIGDPVKFDAYIKNELNLFLNE